MRVTGSETCRGRSEEDTASLHPLPYTVLLKAAAGAATSPAELAVSHEIRTLLICRDLVVRERGKLRSSSLKLVHRVSFDWWIGLSCGGDLSQGEGDIPPS
ncbi:hypothetical protein HRR83_006008 [Exophiala dermatitidis]|uniref:Uncharacterized protein n=1 Tax=Exophiala dermatitidis TaxID=5970 RepID=A0AAN6EPB2_EXODE|nr:hypothetical protein HRR74_005405 [Exophiala dermatitidis]KAJ4517431.1 hypothetical protein HRR73_004483 [Exophiala dermatitidis]KAJ4548816.1 hypothetical protein HRR76_001396 [Exophiala dermatitidis]KAJ4552463.1 hypothetical protein HRR77_002473 [Exophiala dermatitidis]KAJ4566974.1 hypothetical protein HRR81_007050 [Exophiala dermatitidis]